MARTVKSSQERKQEILEASRELFFSEGYDATSVNRIIEVLGISKGAFYHHFRSKEELLDGLVHQLTQTQLAALQPILDDAELTAVDKLNRFYAQSRGFKREHAAALRSLMQVMYRPENLILRHRMAAASVEAARPALAQIVAQGMAERSFDCADAELTAELILELGTSLSDAIATELLSAEPSGAARDQLARLEQRVRVYEDAVERLLGAKAGSILIIDSKLLAALCGTRTRTRSRSERRRP